MVGVTYPNMSNEQLLILTRFPYLVPICKNFRTYKGYISAGTEHFHVVLEVPFYPTQSHLQLHGSRRLVRLLRGRVPPLGDSLLESLCNVQQSLENTLSSDNVLAAKAMPAMSRVRSVLGELGSHRVVKATAALDCIVIGHRDDAGREHRLSLRRQGAAFTLEAVPDLPPPLPWQASGASSLSAWVQPWNRQVSCLQPLWSRLADLDDACWVTDPCPASLRDTHRRVVIGNCVWAVITLDPERPWDRPDIKLLGPEDKLQPIRENLEFSLANHAWDPQTPLPLSLLSALGLDEYPSCPTSGTQGQEARAPSPLVHSTECSICFEARDQSEALPEEACQSDACPAHFHATCLFQWLDALRCPADFSRIRGACPNCDAAISCPAP